MRKRIASLFLVLALCLSLLPTAALAEETQDTTPENDIPVSEPVRESEVDEAVEAVRSAIDALPAAEEWADLTAEEQKTAAEDASAAYEAYEELTEEQQTALSGELEKLIALFGKINSEVAPLALSGSGTEDSPYAVSSAEDWAAVCEKAKYGRLKVHVNVTFTLPAKNQTFTYDKTGKTPGMATASAKGIQLEVQYTGTSTDDTAYNSIEAPVKAGSYQVIYKVPDSNADYHRNRCFLH